MGMNLAALRVVGMQIKENSVKEFVDGEEEEGAEEENTRKRAFVHVA
jgi:U3 small nucleolar RNA-associated protein 12